MSLILAGPWVGEFGWELFCWQGYLRKLSNNGNQVIVVSSDSRKFLYEDFCHDFIPFNPEGSEVDAFKCHDFSGNEEFEAIKSKIDHEEYIDPREGVVFYYNNNSSLCKNFFSQEFHKYGTKSDDGYDIILHARSTEKCGTYFRNWPSEKWESLVNHFNGLRVATIGSKDASIYAKGTDDLRGIGLKELSSIMASSKVMVGPSSGPMHFASLCGLGQVVWSEMKNERKYKKDWNPFGTRVSFYSKDSWDPSVNKVRSLIEDSLR